MNVIERSKNRTHSFVQRVGRFVLWPCMGSILVAGCSSSSNEADIVTPQSASLTCQAPSTGVIHLPADDSTHSEPVEWWYWTGHLKTEDGRWFGFEQTFFSTVQSGVKAQMVNTALTDIDGKRFLTRSSLVPGPPRTVENGFALAVSGETAVGGNGHDRLHGVTDGRAIFDLELDAQKPPVAQYGDGYVAYAPSGYAYYYSRERMSAKGMVVLDGKPLAVTGQAWFDHEWGQLSDVVQRGWHWFAIQLDDGREMMLYALNSGEPSPIGSLSDAQCNVTQIDSSEVEITPTGNWTNSSGCTYPTQWHVKYKDIDVTIRPALDDQEVVSIGQRYWEGASIVSGSATGRAYVELTGYCN
ncbi:hypothetical protein LVJ94_05270 [Pendulispora rubella]|uniref:AttH domain-containing protein n=1 Tax=Pendulispora rubella TaxID=2741070 RepID=A0ABZ2LA03_9BACT